MEASKEEVVRAHILVSGHVQGVGFRGFTHSQATLGQLQGWVRNRAEGDVEMEVEGAKSSVDRFLQAIHQGPALSHVREVTVDWKEPNMQTEGFHILRSS
jgi:acylphosphatase